MQCTGHLAMLFFIGLLLFQPSDGEASSSRRALDEEQVRLDDHCAAAREVILSRERTELVAECVADRSRRTRAECERFYADHGDATAARGPLYLDLPECVEAHEFRQNRPRR